MHVEAFRNLAGAERRFHQQCLTEVNVRQALGCSGANTSGDARAVLLVAAFAMQRQMRKKRHERLPVRSQRNSRRPPGTGARVEVIGMQMYYDVAVFMDAVDLQDADVFGYSMAGLQLAIRHPERSTR